MLAGSRIVEQRNATHGLWLLDTIGELRWAGAWQTSIIADFLRVVHAGVFDEWPAPLGTSRMNKYLFSA
jgi:hypothetical protein